MRNSCYLCILKLDKYAHHQMNLRQVYTKRIIADYMVGMFTIADGARVLDPCFGGGVFVESLLENTSHNLLGVEIDKDSYDRFENPNPTRCQLLNCDLQKHII